MKLYEPKCRISRAPNHTQLKQSRCHVSRPTRFLTYTGGTAQKRVAQAPVYRSTRPRRNEGLRLNAVESPRKDPLPGLGKKPRFKAASEEKWMGPTIHWPCQRSSFVQRRYGIPADRRFRTSLSVAFIRKESIREAPWKSRSPYVTRYRL